MIYVQVSTHDRPSRPQLHKFHAMEVAMVFVSDNVHKWSEFKIFTHDSDMGRLFELVDKLGHLWGRMLVTDSTHGNFISKSDAAFEMYKLREELELVLTNM